MNGQLGKFRKPSSAGDPPDLHTGAFEGTILTEGISDSSDDLYVRLDGYSIDAKWGPCPWSPRVDDGGDVLYPNRGDRCLVLMSTEEIPWVIAWQPA